MAFYGASPYAGGYPGAGYGYGQGFGAPRLPTNKKGIVPAQYSMGPWAAGPVKMTRAQKKALKKGNNQGIFGLPASGLIPGVDVPFVPFV